MQMQWPLRPSQTSLLRFLPCARLNPPAGRGFNLQHLPPRLSSLLSSTSQRQEQKKDDYYSLILSSSSLKSTNPISKPAATDENPKIENNNKKKKKGEYSSQAKVIFGSRLAGPAAREKKGWAQERPPEPDNCCMSGCVNCVWDAYREEVEEWATKGQAGNSSVTDARAVQGQQGGTTTDTTKEFQREDLFEGVPVGIREFMALEKRLREKEASEEGKG